MTGERFFRVFRTARVEAAGARQQRAYEPLVGAHQRLQGCSNHGVRKLVRSRRSCNTVCAEALTP
jgi:hypothetical protein